MSATEAVMQQAPTNAKAIDGNSSDEESITQETIYYPVVQRDPQDIRTILRLSFSSLLFAVLSLTLSGLLIYKLTRRPELIVVERTAEGDRVVGDDRHYAMQGSVQVETA